MKQIIMKQSDKVWLSIIAITILTLCFFASHKFPEEPKRDTGVILVNYESQKY